MAESAGKQRGSRGATGARNPGGAPAARPESNGMGQQMTDLDFLRGLIEAVDRSGIDTLEINRAGTRIRIAKTPQASHAPAAAYHSLPAPALTLHAGGGAPQAVHPPAPAAPGAAAAEPSAVEAAAHSNLVDIKSPMVGTFYRAPAPDAPPYVEVGSHVSRGQTLCILEAMKLMNELEAEVDGVVKAVLVEDADPVEFGQVLFRIEPTGSR